MIVIQANLPSKSYPIIIKAGSVCRDECPFPAGEFFTERGIVVTHQHLWKEFGRGLTSKNRNLDCYLVREGEESKDFSELEEICLFLAQKRIDRGHYVWAFGGGVIGDLAGFAAAVYKRGIGLIQVPATLLAQVDSSIGGKVAVNLGTVKNLAGAFYQPSAVLIDPELLLGLPEKEIACGMAEVIKYGLIMDRDFFKLLESNTAKVKARNLDFLSLIIEKCCHYKLEAIGDDERDLTGKRVILNFGHTVGHALESLGRFQCLRHGESISLGMITAADLSTKMGLLSAGDYQRIKNLLVSYNLPVCLKADFSPAEVLEKIKDDKKIFKEKENFVLLSAIGETVISDVPCHLLTDSLKEVLC